MSKPTIAFFGATGGCGLSTLHRTLTAGYTCTALVRDASKLKKLLAEKGVSEQSIQEHLTIVQGSAQDGSVVEQTLLAPNKVDGQLVDIVISSLGAALSFQMSLTQPAVVDQPTICGDCAKVQLESIEKLQAKSAQAAQSKPLFLAVSTTGISEGKRDIPVAMIPMYHVLLATPHEDKKRMETQLRDSAKKANSPLNGLILVRPSLLVDGQTKGIDKIHHGTDEAPARGYTITRDDVGLFIFEKIIKDDGRDQWKNEIISLTL